MSSGSTDLFPIPSPDHLLLEALEQDDLTPSGIALPETARTRAPFARVVAADPKMLSHPQAGDLVYFLPASAVTIRPIDVFGASTGKEYLILHIEDVLAWQRMPQTAAPKLAAVVPDRKEERNWKKRVEGQR